jgi:hypothetical protein
MLLSLWSLATEPPTSHCTDWRWFNRVNVAGFKSEESQLKHTEAKMFESMFELCGSVPR